MSAPRTPEEEALESWQPNQTLFNAGQAASYGKNRQAVEEGAGGYSGIANPVLAARMKQIGLEELADQESSARADAQAGYNDKDLQNKQYLAALRKPQYVQTGSTSTGNAQTVQQAPSLLSGLLSGGLGLASAFI
jgi:hypothetical protein